MEIIKGLNETLPENSVVLNCKELQNIAAMFYNDCIAYNRIPTEQEIAAIKQEGYNVLIFDDGKLPKYILDDPAIRRLEMKYY